MAKRITKLERELALALDIASRLNLQKGGSINKGECNAWGNPSMFQDKINELLERAGRKAICPTLRAVDEGDSAPSQAESTPEHLPIEEADTTPALRN